MFTRKIRYEPDCLAREVASESARGSAFRPLTERFVPYREITTFRPPLH